MSWNTLLARSCALPAAAGLVVLTAGPAAAHVGISPTQAAAGSYAVLTVSVPHGCDGSPTTKVTIRMPEQILSVTPTRHPLWQVEKVMEKLDEPVTGEHGSITERVGRVVYTARAPLPEGYRDAFELSLEIPDAEGETLTFPTVQACEKGETAWVETRTNGNAEELEAPAPTVTVLPAEADGRGATTASETEPVASTDGGDQDDSRMFGIAGLVTGLLGLAAGVAALVQVRRRGA